MISSLIGSREEDRVRSSLRKDASVVEQMVSSGSKSLGGTVENHAWFERANGCGGREMIHYLGTCIAVGIGLGWVVEHGAGEHKRIIGLRVTDILARDKFAVILRRVRKVSCDSVVHYTV
jgi:hypothetical protein